MMAGREGLGEAGKGERDGRKGLKKRNMRPGNFSQATCDYHMR
jgi:hypothetical protein